VRISLHFPFNLFVRLSADLLRLLRDSTSHMSICSILFCLCFPWISSFLELLSALISELSSSSVSACASASHVIISCLSASQFRVLDPLMSLAAMCASLGFRGMREPSISPAAAYERLIWLPSLFASLRAFAIARCASKFEDLRRCARVSNSDCCSRKPDDCHLSTFRPHSRKIPKNRNIFCTAPNLM